MNQMRNWWVSWILPTELNLESLQLSCLTSELLSKERARSLYRAESRDIIDEADLRREQTVLETTMCALVPALPALTALLSHPPQRAPLKTSSGILDPPLGRMRLALTELFSALLSTKWEPLKQALVEAETASILLDLFFKYSQNNILHGYVESCIHNIVFWGEENPALAHLVSSGRIFDRLLAAWYPPSPVRPVDYSGHVTKMTNDLVFAMGENQSYSCSTLLRSFSKLPMKTQEKWKELVEGNLKKV